MFKLSRLLWLTGYICGNLIYINIFLNKSSCQWTPVMESSVYSACGKRLGSDLIQIADISTISHTNQGLEMTCSLSCAVFRSARAEWLHPQWSIFLSSARREGCCALASRLTSGEFRSVLACRNDTWHGGCKSRVRVHAVTNGFAVVCGVVL